MITLDEYQRRAAETAIYPDAGDADSAHGLAYVALGLAGEAGEIANKAKKVLRDDAGVITDEARMRIIFELGDVLWYVAQTATQLGADLESIAGINIAKLASRSERGTLQGSGDSR
ncbi:nucleoside triphosphate pyrophosphohydrolase family protein [Mycobacteroides abscessus]|uniref:nucleoside triphosphate pyrophosphohydrolase family protein n=1 Tax=Mycobacteroides abscessus TaxID=36809 RepID=UPI00092B300A|nr:nucleoside triphosphate pyrophosphohydrolase family protein [Mycobacteroides abscessus]DAZ90204.1 TPA_asm: MazG-like nucleotide pyrophosphohydrolase [Mycobacterium phage prophiFSIL01-1]SHZ91278.1 MazG nucleotide pyrophosphohydrolase domain [Mycobacteroides abscessus subsp. abscessus]SIA08627.1 MazG nucleotide pyrophosphohydrolase domain [Mycobacteroides abscessus subsp. abscessus]SIA66298.1 MazG nucleotide pyrophosphohydrolase domain [Mycobacteroides abscessus subsp. abscessus]SIA71548.1 Ma